MALEERINIRVSSDTLDLFKKKCEPIRPYQDMIREMMEAFNEGRMKIKLSDNQRKNVGELYE